MNTLVELRQLGTRPPTFSDATLEQDFISFCQLVSPQQWKPTDLERGRIEMLAQVANYIHMAEFDGEDAAEQICRGELLESIDCHDDASPSRPMHSSFASLCASRLLTIEEERSVMSRMHFFKFMALKVLNSEAVDDWDLARAHGLIRAALWHRDLIVQSNMRLVVSIVKKLPVAPNYHDELVSDGVIALLRAVDRFDPSRGYRFSSYATPAVRRECFHQIQLRIVDCSRYIQSTEIPAIASSRDSGEVMSDRAYWLSWRRQLRGLMVNLTRREQLIIRSRFCLGPHRRIKTLQRLADALKISKERVRQLERSAMAKLRRAAQSQHQY